MSEILCASVRIDTVAIKGRGVFAERHFLCGETVVVGRPERRSPCRTIYSLQMDVDLHVDFDEPGRVINHSCEPNTGVRNNEHGGYDFVALRDLLIGEEITFDYETTEYISIAVPRCHCGARACRGQTRGFKYLPQEIRDRYGVYIADYLKGLREVNRS
jgi:hypothetical protein